MIKGNFFNLFIIILIINGCSKVRESAGVARKSPDEFNVIENPPLVIPPNYNLISPEQLQEKKIENIESDLAKEILFGLEEENIKQDNQISTMNEILSKAKTNETSENIRDEINETFANEVQTNDSSQFTWENEQLILDAVKESERIREKKFNKQSITEGEIPVKKEKVEKKKKRFFIF